MSTVQRSENCNTSYEKTVTTLVHAKAVVPGEEGRCSVDLPLMFSCQEGQFETIDEVTRAQYQTLARDKLYETGCDGDRAELRFATNIMGAEERDYTGEKLSKLGMASSCFRAGNDPNDVTHMARFTCRNDYEMIDEHGRRVRDSHRTSMSNLATCDMSDGAMPQLMEDGRKVAAYNASLNGLTMEREVDLACAVSILPVN